MIRRVRAAFLVIAVALLATGIAGPVRRAFDDHRRAQAAQQVAELAARERADATAALEANRVAILADIRERLDKGDNAEALKRASRYMPARDPEIRALFSKAAAAESQRQRIDAYAALVMRDCNEAMVREQIVGLLAAAPGAVAGSARIAQLTRMTGAPGRDLVLSRLNEPPDPEDVHERPGAPASSAATAPATPPHVHAPQRPPGDDWVARMRRENRARPLPELPALLAGAQGNELICAWHAEGTRRASGREMRFAMDAWLAPKPDGKSLGADPVRYTER